MTPPLMVPPLFLIVIIVPALTADDAVPEPVPPELVLIVMSVDPSAQVVVPAVGVTLIKVQVTVTPA